MSTSAQLALGEWAPPLLPELGQWHTPAWLAERIVRWAGVREDMRVLEPSAGGGNLVRALAAAGAFVNAVEIDPDWARALRADKSLHGMFVIEADFLDLRGALETYPDCELAVMNPPLDGGVGPRHIWQALQLVPRVVSVLRSVDLHGVERHKVLWSRAVLAGVVYCVRRPTFGGDASCSPSSGAQADFVVVDVWRDGSQSRVRPPEWW